MRGKSVHLELVQGWLTGKVWELNYGNNKNGSTTNDGDGDGTTTSWTLVHDFEKKRNGFNKSKYVVAMTFHPINGNGRQMEKISHFQILSIHFGLLKFPSFPPLSLSQLLDIVQPTRTVYDISTKAGMSFAIMRHEGCFYRGFGTSLMGTIPARALYMTVLEVTKSNVGTVTVRLGYSDTTANAAAGLSSAMAIQLVWTLDPN
ncbi:hypothetical protein F8388_017783 [Cannabis sativa]|uniref:Uncharacterized protein n=1 Tax=Cannabis sativa TaxID=3483 RepID=A0A7J6E5C7_CANSA|nr:hypothetical protein F8388_017783 [Cannabis sativa]